MGAATKACVASNVIPFRRRNASHLFYVCDGTEQNSSIQLLSKGHHLSSLCSLAEIHQTFYFFKPSLIIVRADLKWGNPIELIRTLNQLYSCPILLLFPRRKTSRDDLFIKKAYQAGIIDILQTPLAEDANETIQLVLRLSKRTLNLVF